MTENGAKFIENLTWVEFKQIREKIKTVILPWGAVEAHGPHLPLSTDTIIANHIAQIIAGKIGAFLLPPIPIGYCFHVSNFPGTISFTEDTLQNMAFEIAESLHGHGIQNMIFISGHGGNVEPFEKVARKIRKKLKMKVIVIYPFYTDERLVERFNQFKTSESVCDIYHAEELETSLVLAISPQLVKMKEAKIEYFKVPKEYLGYKKKLGDLTEYCVFGDPTAANIEKGNQFLEIMVEEISKIIASSEMDREDQSYK